MERNRKSELLKRNNGTEAHFQKIIVKGLQEKRKQKLQQLNEKQ